MGVARGEDMNAANTPGAWEALSDGDLAGSLLEALWGSPVPIAIFDSQLRVARVNPAMAQLNGVSASAHVGRRLSEALPLLDVRAEESLRQVMRTGQPLLNVAYSGETEAVPGAKRDWLGSVFPVRGPRGEAIGLCVIVNEISALRRQEDAARRAQADAERASRRLEALQQLGEPLSSALTPARVAHVVLHVGLPLLDADAGSVAAIEQGALVVLGRSGFCDETIACWARAHGARPTPHSDAMASGNPVFLERLEEDLKKLYPEQAQLLGPTPFASAVVVPLMADGRALGLLSLAFTKARSFSGDDRSFILALAAQCAQALHRARLFEAEQQQRARAEQNALLLDTFIAAAPCGLAFFDTELRYRKINPALAAINGQPVGEHLGRSADGLVGHPGTVQALRQVAATHAPLEGLSLAVQTPGGSGRSRSWLASIFPVCGPEGTLFGVGTTVTEVTSLRDSEHERERLLGELREALRERNESVALLEHLLDAAPLGFALLGPDLRFLEANRAFAALWGDKPAEDYLGKTFADFAPAPLAERATAQCKQVLASGEPMTDVEFCGEDCGRRWAYLGSWFPVRSADRVLGLGVVLRDVAAQRAAQEFQRHLLGIVGHELRNPLAAISASAACLLHSSALSGRDRQVLTRIAAGSSRIERIVGDLLDFTLVHAGKGIPVSRQPADLGSLCLQVIDEIEASQPQAKIACRGEGDGRGEWDAARLAQLVANLVTNALKHGAQGSSIEVRWHGSEDEVLLEVRNSGEPIAEALLPHLFQPFGQASHSDHGIGLGLFISRQIAAAHGGTIEARSDLSEGTVFSVRLPRRQAGRDP